jgi:hypothetical protein
MTTTQTPGQIFQALPAGKFATLAKISPRGALLLRKLKNGTGMFYWRSSTTEKSCASQSVRLTRQHHQRASSQQNAAIRSVPPFELLKFSPQHLGNIDGGGYQSLKKAKKKSWLRRRKEQRAGRANA